MQCKISEKERQMNSLEVNRMQNWIFMHALCRYARVVHVSYYKNQLFIYTNNQRRSKYLKGIQQEEVQLYI